MKKFYENEKTELKSELNDKLEKSVVAFLNSKTGGDIFIGIKDNGEIIGVKDQDKIQLSISDKLKNNIFPTCLGLFDVYCEEMSDKPVIHIVVSSGTEKPYYLKKLGMSPSGCYIRVGSGVKQMDTRMIEQFYSSRTRNSLRNILSPRYMEHTFSQLKIYYEEHGYQLNDAFLHNLDLYTNDGKFNYVAYLLADKNSVPIRFAKYAGRDKCDLVENEDYGFCSIAKSAERILDKLEIENKTFTRITGDAKRIELRMINKVALREALINAIVHNDYSREIAPVIEMYSDRLSITSYGGLVEGLSIEEFFSGRSIPRNRELMRVFRDLELVEHLGSGMNRILNAYDRSIFKFSENFIEVTFPFPKEFLSKSEQATEQVPEQLSEQVTEQVERLIFCIGHQEMSIKEILNKIGLKHRPTLVYDYIKPALKMKIIEMKIPDTPNSPKQKYRLAEKGLYIIKKEK